MNWRLSVICLFLLGSFIHAESLFSSRYEESSQLVENIQHGYVYRSLQNYILTTMDEYQPRELTHASSPIQIFYPSYLIADDSPSLLVVIPQSPNPFLIALSQELAAHVHRGNSNFSLLLLAPAISTSLQEQFIMQSLQDEMPVLWLDETVTSGDIYTQKAPLHLITALRKVRKPNISLQIHGSRLLENISQSFFSSFEDSPLAQADIPLLRLSGRSSISMTDEWGNAFISMLIDYADLLATERAPPPVDWQHQYLSLLWGTTVILPEHILLLITYITVLFALAMGIFAPFSLQRFASTILGHWKAIGILLFLITSSVVGAHFLVQLLIASAFQTNWLLFIKIFLAMLIFTQSYYQVSQLRLFHRATKFLSSLVILVTLILLISIVAVHLSASLHVAILFLLMTVVSFSRNIISKTIFFILSIILFIPELLFLDNTLIANLIDFLLNSPIWGNVFLIAVLMPFLFALLRLRHLTSPKRRRIFLRITQLAIIAGIGLALPTLFSSLSNSPPIAGKEYISDNSHWIEFSDKFPLGNFTFQLGNIPYQVSTSKLESYTKLPLQELSFSYEASRQRSDELQNYSIQIRSSEPIDSFTLIFETPGNYFIPYYSGLASSLPLGNPVEKMSFTALSPPPSFQVHITLTASQDPLILAQATYDHLSSSFSSDTINAVVQRIETQEISLPP